MGRRKMSERTGFYIEGKEFLAEPYHYMESGLDSIFLLNGVSEAETDYGPMVHVENINGLHRAIGLHIVEKDEPICGPEFRFLRKQMGLTQSELAKDFDVSDQTIANYEKGKTGLGPADTLMRMYYLLSILPSDMRAEAVRSILRPASKARKKLPEVPRRKLVEHWVENGLQAA
jgi:transcriptional regulator with XRE-family HTH domain